MSGHNELGEKGEALAVAWFQKKGFEILHRNWRHSHWEVDIIASNGKLLHFIEVKTRSNKQYGEPEESVGKKKIQNLMNAAEEYLYQNPDWKRIQFDILSIYLPKNGEPEYFLIEDVY